MIPPGNVLVRWSVAGFDSQRTPVSVSVSLWRWTMTDKYSELRKKGKLFGSMKRARNLAKKRKELLLELRSIDRKAAVAMCKKENRMCSIPFGPTTSEELQRRGEKVRSRVKNWTEPRPCKENATFKVEKWQDGYYNGGSRMHPLFRYTAKLRCCGAVCRGRLVWFFADETRKLTAPHGWRFGQDWNGLYVERKKNNKYLYRYHFTDEDLKTKSTLRTAAMDHELSQAATDKREKAWSAKERVAERVGVFVTAKDSYDSGNCFAGTATWARRSGLNTRRAYPLRVIERLAKGDKQVLRACSAAVRRTVNDIDRGYCSLTPPH
jgi:hypothetical protein